jgi:hypothetical protein
MYILLAYGTYVLLVAVAATVIFGVCALVIAVQEALRFMGRKLAKLISMGEVQAERIRGSWAQKPICARQGRVLLLPGRDQRRASLGRLNCRRNERRPAIRSFLSRHHRSRQWGQGAQKRARSAT